MFDPVYHRTKSMKAGKDGQLDIERIFILYQTNPDGTATKDNHYGMLTTPGYKDASDTLNDCWKWDPIGD